MSSENVLSNKVGVWVLILLFLFVFYRCSTPNDNKVINEIKYAHPMDSHAIALVRETQVNDKGMQFVTAPLKNGIAVLTGPAAYWVSQDQVYSVNGVAMTWSPSTKKSPEEITYLQLVDAIERYQKIKLD